MTVIILSVRVQSTVSKCIINIYTVAYRTVVVLLLNKRTSISSKHLALKCFVIVWLHVCDMVC